MEDLQNRRIQYENGVEWLGWFGGAPMTWETSTCLTLQFNVWEPFFFEIWDVWGCIEIQI